MTTLKYGKKESKIAKDWESTLFREFRQHHNDPAWKAHNYLATLQNLLGDKAPGLSSVQHKLQEKKEDWEKMLETEDISFTLASLADNSFPPEALPFILEVWLYSRNNGLYFSTRQAHWVARIYPIFKEVNKLWGETSLCAEEELLYKIAGVSMDGYDGPQGILRLYEDWQGEFSKEAKSNLLLEPVYPKGRSPKEHVKRTELVANNIVKYNERTKKQLGMKDNESHEDSSNGDELAK